jgi:hypothetical protein
MNKYTIEGGLNFYEELYKSLDIEETNEKTEEDQNLCLITNQTLTEKFVEMNCGHKFNYVPLFLDLKNHKQRFNGMEGSSGKLSTDEIRCPYCRTKQTDLLPYYEEFGFPKINGVNDIKPYSNSLSYAHTYYKPCEFLTPNPDFDTSGNNIVETEKYNKGNCKFHICICDGTQINSGYNSSAENYGDTKHYCWSHKKVIIKKYKQEIKNKAKEEAMKEKLKTKEEAKKAKDEAKLKAKEEEKKSKEEEKKSKKNSICENVVLGQIDLSGNNVIIGCVEILKSGQNKGNHCGCKILMDNLCNRHFKIKNGIVMNNI